MGGATNTEKIEVHSRSKKSKSLRQMRVKVMRQAKHIVKEVNAAGYTALIWG